MIAVVAFSLPNKLGLLIAIAVGIAVGFGTDKWIWHFDLGMAFVTFLARYSMIAMLARWQVSPDVTRALEFVPIAAFAALVAPELVLRDGQFAMDLGNARLIAGIGAIIIAFLTRNVLITLVTGMGVMWIVQGTVGR
jgi:branched-subunit amino acid transport protein